MASPPTRRARGGKAALAKLNGDFVRAAEFYTETGDVDAEAASRLRTAERLLTAIRRGEALLATTAYSAST